MSLVTLLIKVLPCWGEQKIYFMSRLLVNLYIIVAFLWQQERRFILQILLWELLQGSCLPSPAHPPNVFLPKWSIFQQYVLFASCLVFVLAHLFHFPIRLCIKSCSLIGLQVLSSFVQSENSVIKLHHLYQRLPYHMKTSWFSVLSLGLCNLKHFLQVAAEQRDLERMVTGPARASKWTSSSQLSKCLDTSFEFGEKLLFDMVSLSCTDMHWQFHVDCSLHEYAMWSSIGNHMKMEINLICFLLVCKVYHCITEQKSALFDNNLDCFSQRHMILKSYK